MVAEQINYNTEKSRRYSEENKCTVWVMCSQYFNNDDERDKELVGTYNPAMVEAMKLSGFYTAFKFVNGMRQ